MNWINVPKATVANKNGAKHKKIGKNKTMLFKIPVSAHKNTPAMAAMKNHETLVHPAIISERLV
jgi:hypothetical protein